MSNRRRRDDERDKAPRKPMILVEDVCKTYERSPVWMRLLVKSPIEHDIHALRGVSFEIGPGEICAMVGPNGAGKTTAFRILVGLTTPSEGVARVMGFDATRESLEVRRLVGWMPTEDRSLLMRLTGIENLRFHGRLHGLNGPHLEKRILDILDQVGLGQAGRNSVFAMSAGMKARLQLARALLHDPRVLILDEPTASIDPVASYEVVETIIRIVRERRIAALISSHRLDEIEALHSRVLLLDRGQIRYDGDLDALRGSFDRPYVRMSVLDSSRLPFIAEVIERSDSCVVTDTDTSTIEFELLEESALGRVLGDIGDQIEAISSVERMRTPLRTVLANLYRNDGAVN